MLRCTSPMTRPPAMCGPRASATCFLASFLLVQSLVALASAQGSATRWQTLSGNSPKVIARGGFSGLFSDSSSAAYQLATFTSLSDVILWCDVQLTKDGIGICAPDLKLDNSTNIAQIYSRNESTYSVNGVPVKGWFSIDFTLNDLWSKFVSYTQGIYSRSSRFDGNFFEIQTVENVSALKPPGLWLNIQHDLFFTQHNLSMRSYVLSISRKTVINYISSPEVGFLRSISSRVNLKITKMVFRFMAKTDTEPSTNQTYGSLLSNLTFVKTFASGILIPKDYIWPIDSSGYLQTQTYNSIVVDAHNAGLEVYASDFFNDVPLSYNYSYDPVTEYLYYINNGNFSVDGVVSDFPITPSEAIGCFAHLGKHATETVKLLVISKNGASGDYPGCTDLAYENAISDGADVIDCPIQMSADGIPFCFGSINLIVGTDVLQTKFSTLTMKIPELIPVSGIFTFNLTWEQIQTLKPIMVSPYSDFELYRNPKFPASAKLVALSDFLALAKNRSSLSGVLINIENAPYLIERQGLPVTDAVLKVLGDSGYNSQIALKVMIQSSNSSVLMKFKDQSNYELVYNVDENIRDAFESAIQDIKKFAHSVVVSKASVFPDDNKFLTGYTDVVTKLQSANLSVYVQTFSNEFVSQAWDFFSDPTVELNSYVTGAGIDGVITDFPKTSARYKRNRCLAGNNTPSYMSPVEPGSLIKIITSGYLPPAEAPNPVLDMSDVLESPLPSLPPVAARSPASSPTNGTATAPSRPNGQPKIVACAFISVLAMLFTILLLL